MKNTFIFDFDGTIADSFPLLVQVANDLADKFHYRKIQETEIKSLRDKSARQLLQEYNIPLLKLPWIATTAKRELNKRIKTIKPIPGITEVLKKLKENNIKLGILSSNSVENIQIFLNNNDLDIFDFIYSEHNIFGKHRGIEKVIKKEALDKSTIFYVGDEVRDIEACKKINLDCIAVTWGFNSSKILKKHHPYALISTPDELLNIIKK